MPIAVRGVISYTLTDEELIIGRALRRNREFSSSDNSNQMLHSSNWDYTEMEEFDYKIRSKFGIPSGFFDHTPITNFMELFND